MPAYQMQAAIQQKVMGKRFWNKITAKRLRNMDADEWVKQTHGNAKKVDTKAILKGYREQQAKEMLERMKVRVQNKFTFRGTNKIQEHAFLGHRFAPR